VRKQLTAADLSGFDTVVWLTEKTATVLNKNTGAQCTKNLQMNLEKT